MPTTIYLIRHGATPANEAQPAVLQGCSVDRSLSDHGRDQAAALGRWLSRVEFDAVYSSPLRRARETAEAVAAHGTGAVRVCEELKEVDVGVWEKLTWSEIQQQFPDEYQAFMDGQPEVPYLGGESYLDVLHRVRPQIDSIARRHDQQNVAIVGHYVVNRMYVADLIGLPFELARTLRMDNTGVNVIRYDDQRTQLVTFNAQFHLDEL